MQSLPIFNDNKILINYKNFHLKFPLDNNNETNNLTWNYNRLDLVHRGEYNDQCIKIYFNRLRIKVNNQKITFTRPKSKKSYSLHENKNLHNNYYSARIKSGEVFLYILDFEFLYFNSRDYSTKLLQRSKSLSRKNDIKFIICGLYHFYQNSFVIQKLSFDLNCDYIEQQIFIKYIPGDKIVSSIHGDNYSLISEKYIKNGFYNIKIGIKDTIFNIVQTNILKFETNDTIIFLSCKDNVINVLTEYFNKILFNKI